MSLALLGTGPGVLKASGSLGRLQVHTQPSCLFFFFFLKLTKTQTDRRGSWKAESCSGRAGAAEGVGFQIWLWHLVQAAWGPGHYPMALISRIRKAGGGGLTGTACPAGSAPTARSALNSELYGTKASFLESPGSIPNLHSLSRRPWQSLDWGPLASLGLGTRSGSEASSTPGALEVRLNIHVSQTLLVTPGGTIHCWLRSL